MWLSQQSRPAQVETGADVGVVTLDEERPGVYMDGERRAVTQFGPGGYCWRPRLGQRVLVIKAGAAGELPCLAGAEQEQGQDLEPGEVAIRSAGGGAVHLRENGRVDLVGTVCINGVPIDQIFEKIRTESGGSSGGVTAG